MRVLAKVLCCNLLLVALLCQKTELEITSIIKLSFVDVRAAVQPEASHNSRCEVHRVM